MPPLCFFVNYMLANKHCFTEQVFFVYVSGSLLDIVFTHPPHEVLFLFAQTLGQYNIMCIIAQELPAAKTQL